MEKRTTLSLLAVAGLMAFAPAASAITVDWNQPGSTIVSDASTSDFDNATMTFAGILVGDYLGATSIEAHFHDHDPDFNTIFGLDLRVNGSWVNVWTSSAPNGDDVYISSFGGLSLGSSVLLDGIRFTSSQVWEYGYHGFDLASEFGPEYADTFHFRDVPPPPVPDGGATVASLGLALGVIALLRRRFARAS